MLVGLDGVVVDRVELDPDGCQGCCKVAIRGS